LECGVVEAASQSSKEHSHKTTDRKFFDNASALRRSAQTFKWKSPGFKRQPKYEKCGGNELLTLHTSPRFVAHLLGLWLYHGGVYAKDLMRRMILWCGTHKTALPLPAHPLPPLANEEKLRVKSIFSKNTRNYNIHSTHK
jgi:hypothetical protein